MVAGPPTRLKRSDADVSGAFGSHHDQGSGLIAIEEHANADFELGTLFRSDDAVSQSRCRCLPNTSSESRLSHAMPVPPSSDQTDWFGDEASMVKSDGGPSALKIDGDRERSTAAPAELLRFSVETPVFSNVAGAAEAQADQSAHPFPVRYC
tara:strand:+ start:188 stop:643 length:456 start_codon:yes stop_codon:yes gene_type:complete